jgi:hypothetical protein
LEVEWLDRFREAVQAEAERDENPIYQFDHKERRDYVADQMRRLPRSLVLAANPRLIKPLPRRAGAPGRIHHRAAEFVKHHPRGPVAGKTELAL